MKLMFNKIDFNGHWFDDDEYPENFTGKVPPDTGHVFDEEADDWIPKPPPVAEEPEGGEEPGETE
jgi:hypothetical protein